MPKRFRVYGVVVGTKYLGVFEAATKKEAEEKALNSDNACVSLCHQCCEDCEDPEITEARAEEMADGEKE